MILQIKSIHIPQPPKRFPCEVLGVFFLNFLSISFLDSSSKLSGLYGGLWRTQPEFVQYASHFMFRFNLFVSIKEIYEFSLLDVHAVISIWEKIGFIFKLDLFYQFYNNNETSNYSLYKITHHSYWHRCAC